MASQFLKNISTLPKYIKKYIVLCSLQYVSDTGLDRTVQSDQNCQSDPTQLLLWLICMCSVWLPFLLD